MLAQSFMSAADLGITEPQRDALQKVLVLLETEKLEWFDANRCDTDHYPEQRKFSGQFNMGAWSAAHSCGTIACIGGTAEIIGDVSFGAGYGMVPGNAALQNLFCPRSIACTNWQSITPAQAARALRSYLATGDAKWAEAEAA